MKRRLIILIAVLVLILIVATVAAFQFDLSAIPEPGRTETYLATVAKRILISRSSRHGIPPAPPATQTSITEGDTLFGVDCSACHGMTGRTPTETGRWLYPRAEDLGSPAVQQYSDRELFWIVNNGIRLSGMPGFARVESEEHIWDLVHFLRTLPEGAHSTETPSKEHAQTMIQPHAGQRFETAGRRSTVGSNKNKSERIGIKG